MIFDDLPAGAVLFLDANVLTYYFEPHALFGTVCKKLIDLANEAGGPDNITVVAARFEGPGLKESGAEAPAHRVYRGSQQQRSTIPVDRSSIPGVAAVDISEMPTLETELSRSKMRTPRTNAPVDPSAETVEVSPLSAWYLSQLPPQVVGIEARIARGHRGVEAREKCSPLVSAVVRAGLDRGDIGWRDLVDFYSRHRCQTYQFPSHYRALKSDGERAMPAVGG